MPISAKTAFVSIGVCSVLVMLCIAPLPAALMQPSVAAPTQVIDRDGVLLYEARSGTHGAQQSLTFDEIPASLIQAVIMTEDRAFYTHPGISVSGIARAAYDNLQAHRIISGGSTITQQLVKIRLQPQARTYAWKLAELYFALRLEWQLTKQQILTAYLNEAYFGHQAYGIAAASDTYFGKQVSALSIAEEALLAGLLKAPDSLDPFHNLAGAQKRQKRILQVLETAGVIDVASAETAAATPIQLAPDRRTIKAPHFVMMVLENEKLKMQNVQQNNPSLSPITNTTTIRTTLDLDLQTEVELIVKNELAKLADKNVTSAGVVVLDAKNGDVLALLGSHDYFDTEHAGQVNRVTASRQPGSALKPFTYALALAAGWTPATTITDIETRFFTQDGNPYTPRNYDYGYHGLVRVRTALANSYNISAIKALEFVGVPRLLHLLSAAGITTLTRNPAEYGLALTLGDGEVRLLELAAAYGIFARGGETLPVRTLLNQCNATRHPRPPRRRDPEKNNQQESQNQQSTHKNWCHGAAVLDPRIAYLIADILADNQARIPEFGTDSPLNFSYPVAAKTGTTRNSRDNWTIGFTSDRIVGVWVGNADNSPMRGTSGVTGAGPIFHGVMDAATRNRPHTWVPRPAGMTTKNICTLSGKLPTKHCNETMQELFLTGTEPHTSDEIFREIMIDQRNHLLASPTCPTEHILKKVYAIFPTELRAWARENGYPEPPTQYSPLCQTDLTRTHANSRELTRTTVSITHPADHDSFQLDPLVPVTHQKIILNAATPLTYSGQVEWLVDGTSIGHSLPPTWRQEWLPTIGTHVITAKAGSIADQITIEVVK